MINKINYYSILLITLTLSQTSFSQISTSSHKMYGGSGFDKSDKIILTASGDKLVLGTTESSDNDFAVTTGNDFDAFLMLLNPQNQILWTKTFGGSQFDGATDALETENGDFLILAETNSLDGDVSFNHGSSDTWLFKVRHDGTLLWQMTIGGNGYDKSSKILALPNGNFALLGFSSSSDLSGTSSLGDKDGWMCIVDKDGSVISHQLFGGSGFDLFTDAVVSQNNVLVSGATSSNDNVSLNHFGGFDHWILSFDLNGSIIWQKSSGGAGNDFCEKIILDGSGGFVTVGSIISDVSSGLNSDDISVNRYNEFGNPVWKKSFGGSAKDVGNSVIQSGSNYLVGCTTSSMDGDVSNSFGGNDNWILLLDESGIIVQELNLGGANDDQLVDIISTPATNSFTVVGYSESIYNFSTGGFDIELYELSITNEQLGITESKKQTISLFPNPTANILTVNTMGEDLGTLSLVDLNGKIIVQTEISNSGNYIINVADFQNGVYYIHSEKLQTPLKVVKF